MPQKRAPGTGPKLSGYVVRKRKARLTRQSVLKMLAVMDASQNPKPPIASDNLPPATPEAEHTGSQTFLQSGRTGRRNALANIMDDHAFVSSSDLPSKLEALTTTDKPEEEKKDEPSTSNSKS